MIWLFYHNTPFNFNNFYNLFIDNIKTRLYNLLHVYTISKVGDIVKLKAYFKEHPIIFMMAYAVVYFICFFILEALVDPEKAICVQCPLDNFIPFCEFFIVPYLLWFLVIPSVLFALVFNDRDSFWRMAIMMFGGNMICILIYLVFPSTVPNKLPMTNDNIFETLVNVIYASDTPTNVCPSIHVLDTLAAHIALSRSSLAKNKPILKHLSFIFLVLICIATVTLKQHSIIDVFCAFILMVFLERIAYKKPAPCESAVPV